METKPILFIDDDEDDQFLFKQIILELNTPHPVLTFTNGQAALEYLKTEPNVPFLILSEISLPGMSGLELRQQMEDDEQLRKKSIPFIFVTYPIVDYLVEQAYQLTIQGLFEKKLTYDDWKAQLSDIIRYWTDCYHPKHLAH